VKQFTAGGSRGVDPSLHRGGAPPLGGKLVGTLEAWIEVLFSWGVLVWATAVLYGVFLVS
jgi:hypothetical protein